MTSVTHALINGSGQPLENAYVEIRVLAPRDTSNAYAPNGQIISRYVTHTDESGVWTADLIPTADITPTNAVYIVYHKVSGWPNQTATFLVPDSVSTLHLVDLLVAPPNDLPIEASLITFDPVPAGMVATNVQDAIDEAFTSGGGGGGGGLSAEEIRDLVGATLVAGANATITVDDPGNTITIAVSGLTSAQISNFNEAVQDQIGAHIKSGNSLITVTYDDPGTGDTTLTADLTVLDERIRDTVGTALVQGTGITLTVDDPGNTITIAATGSAPIDVGFVAMKLYNEVQTYNYTNNGGQVEIAPFTSGLNAAYVSHVPPNVQFYYPLAALAAADTLQVLVDQHIDGAVGSFGASISGELMVWNQSGTQLLEASFAKSITQASGVVNAIFTSVQAIGSDLSLTAGNTKVSSAAGGVYNLLITSNVVWT